MGINSMIFDYLLIGIGLMNMINMVFMFNLAWNLYTLSRTQNGAIHWMAMERLALGLIWAWNTSQAIKNLSMFGVESDFDLYRLISLIFRFSLAIFLTLAMYQLRRRIKEE